MLSLPKVTPQDLRTTQSCTYHNLPPATCRYPNNCSLCHLGLSAATSLGVRLCPCRQCCGRHIQGSDIDHAMSCNRLSGSRSRLHDHWKEALSRIFARTGCNARTEPIYSSVGVAAVGRQGARADIEVTLPPPHGPTLLDISMIHTRCATYVAAASQTRGAAAALRDRDKYRAHAGHLHPGHTFVPASVETYGPSCGTFVPSATSRRHALWPSPGDRSLLVPTGN
jgi:hypothetical protein